ncbi:FAD-binding and (Fe-S)-binding domain-containing protein [Dactylosporangium sp. CA-233914]|uniref:FAD-binding and (Fe-S)-binding domain-containing protein n=1 Tax=Dactylosporangium sp. CA-233914 TaxID=3239934 RepID=UPI003D91E138
MPHHPIAARLRAAGVRHVLDDPTTRAAYSSDASVYRVPPLLVVQPRHTDEVHAVLDACRAEGVPLTPRGAGTSVAGNAVGDGVVLDLSRHLDNVLEIDPEAKTATVQPGVVHATLQGQTRRYGLRFGPDPSTHSRCTIGGMIGNNACGSRSLAYGRTSDNVTSLRVLTAAGTSLDTGGLDALVPADPARRLVDDLRALVGDHLAVLRTELGRFGRQVSGYALEHLLPERGFDLTRALVGSEGTLAVVTEATVRLVEDPAHRVLLVLGFPDMGMAGDAAPAVLEHHPTACEGLDRRIVDTIVRRKGPAAVPALPGGAAWLFVELSGTHPAELAARARRLAAAVEPVDHRLVTDPDEIAPLWRIREDGAGLAGRTPSGLPTHAGWEDAAVPPERLGDYLRDFDELTDQYGLTGMPFGHFGDGCVHVRLDFPLDRPGGTDVMHRFLLDAARLVARYGGSLSGEHGDGRARSELLPLMYGPEVLATFAAVKHLFDPDNLLNPGVLVDPEPAVARVRVAGAAPQRRSLAFAYEADGGDFGQAIHRCTGVGKCRADTRTTGGVMCPSFAATRAEKDSTRGRARVLQEMVNGESSVRGWDAPEVHDALDLCLACKGCASDCPTGIDMATYKAEVLHQTYRRRLRPRTHYTLGWLPRWARLAQPVAGVANRLLARPRVGRWALRLAGVDPQRSLPTFADETFTQWFRRTAPQRPANGRPVVIFVDSFTEYFAPQVGRATVRVLEAAGYRPTLPDRAVCCGLTWISTGQLDAARRILGRTIAVLDAAVTAGVPVVGLEPSCTATLRSDAPELLASDAARRVAGGVRTLAELLLGTPGWEPPTLTEPAVVQPHCHHHAVLGFDADRELLRRAGVDATVLGGCCGLAGNFGVVEEHREVSTAVAEQHLLPAVRAAVPGTAVLADGFSCRTQLADLAATRGRHLAELLADALPGNPP